MLGLFHAQLEPNALGIYSRIPRASMVRKRHQPPSSPPSPRVGSTFSKILLGLEEFARAKRGFLAYDDR